MPHSCAVKLYAFHYPVINTSANAGKLFKIKIDLNKDEALAPTNYGMIVILSQSYCCLVFQIVVVLFMNSTICSYLLNSIKNEF